MSNYKPSSFASSAAAAAVNGGGGMSPPSQPGSSHSSAASVSEADVSKFTRNLHEMVSDANNSQAVGFSPDGLSLELRDADLLSSVVLPRYFKHGNISSLTRQLNNYGFKTNPPRTSANVSQSFTHPYFRKDRVELYRHVKRRSNSVSASSSSASPSPATTTTTTTTPIYNEDKKRRMDVVAHQSSSTPTIKLLTYNQLMAENARLAADNARLEDRIRQLEAVTHFQQQQQVRPQYLMSQQQQHYHRPLGPPPASSSSSNDNNNSQFRLFPPAVAASMRPPQQLPSGGGGGGIRSSGEQARSLFGEDGSAAALDDEDVATLKHMFLRASMDEDQAL